MSAISRATGEVTTAERSSDDIKDFGGLDALCRSVLQAAPGRAAGATTPGASPGCRGQIPGMEESTVVLPQ